jgi:hypothetical protein
MHVDKPPMTLPSQPAKINHRHLQEDPGQRGAGDQVFKFRWRKFERVPVRR